VRPARDARIIASRPGFCRIHGRAVCCDVLRESRQFNPRKFRVVATQQVIDLLC